MKRKRGIFQPSVLDRIAFGILAALHLVGGLYVAGPWYVNIWYNSPAPLQAMFNSAGAVMLFGALLFVTGVGLVYATAGRGTRRYYRTITGSALLSGFLLQLYWLIGTILVLPSWRPPIYLSDIIVVVMLGAYWIWVRIHVRPVQ